MRVVGWCVGLALVGCGGGSSTTSDGGSETTSTSLSSTTSPSDTTLVDETTDTSGGGGLLTQPDVGALPQCELYADDCADGNKCSPYASDGGPSPDATRCIPIADDPAGVDQPCTVQDWSASGLDDCERGLYCVLYDDEQLLGRCVALCQEDPDAPDLVCADDTARCVGGPDIIPRLCSTGCDPFGGTCPGEQQCYRIGDHFTCLDDASGPGGAYGDPCLFTNQCDLGMLCADPPEFFECQSTDGCCTPFCDTREPDASANCPGAPEHLCEPLFEPGEGPPLYEWVGACVVPTKGGP
jgi:hypothetical protein